MLSKGIVYYSDGELDPTISRAVRSQLKRCVNTVEDPMQVVSVTLGTPKPDFGLWIGVDFKRGYVSMFKQILLGLECLSTDIAFLCEHDVLYPPCHFDFTPDLESYWYNTYVYKVSSQTGQALSYICAQTSGLVASRHLLIEHYKKRIELCETTGFSRKMGFEPGTHNRPERVDDIPAHHFQSKFPLVDIRHTTNLTETRWRKDQFRNPKFTEGWTESDSVPGWGKTQGRFDEFLKEL